MRAKGIPTYTQHSVAFPNVPLYERVVDDLNVTFAGDGGDGVLGGSFSFKWMNLGHGHDGVFKIVVFSDSLAVLLDDRVQRVTQELVTQVEIGNRPTPENVIAALETEGFIASHYHLSGLSEQSQTLDEKAALQAKISQVRSLHVED